MGIGHIFNDIIDFSVKSFYVTAAYRFAKESASNKGKMQKVWLFIKNVFFIFIILTIVNIITNGEEIKDWWGNDRDIASFILCFIATLYGVLTSDDK